MFKYGCESCGVHCGLLLQRIDIYLTSYFFWKPGWKRSRLSLLCALRLAIISLPPPYSDLICTSCTLYLNERPRNVTSDYRNARRAI